LASISKQTLFCAKHENGISNAKNMFFIMSEFAIKRTK
jgi:hypothetical protein